MAVCGAVVPRGKSTWPVAGRLAAHMEKRGAAAHVHAFGTCGPKECTWAAALCAIGLAILLIFTFKMTITFIFSYNSPLSFYMSKVKDPFLVY